MKQLWRSGEVYSEKYLSAHDVVLHEINENGNDIHICVPEHVLMNTPSSKCFWGCKTKREASYYGKPYKIVLTSNVLILATDNDGGYYVTD
jgi:hypothetical protein